MRLLLAVLVLLLSTAFGRAQQRQAVVQLDDGRVLQGLVVAMDLVNLQLSIDGEVLTLPAARIQSCRFETPPEPVAEVETPSESVPAQPMGESKGRRSSNVGRGSGAGRTPQEPVEVLAAAALDPDSAPHDLRHRSLWRVRIEALDEAYPWLCPTAPSQWFSLGFLLFTLMTLVVHLSTKVSGADQVSLGRCMVITGWYMVTGLLQFALVPTLDVATVAMLIGNTAMALFWLRSLFGLTRGAAVVGFAVQLGFLLLGYGVLQLADSLLKSVGSAHA